MKLRAGQVLLSAVDTTAVIVTRAPDRELVLSCGGAAMVAQASAERSEPDPAQLDGTLLGKRYADASGELEVLCTKEGPGSLTVGGDRLEVQGAKSLPASD